MESMEPRVVCERLALLGPVLREHARLVPDKTTPSTPRLIIDPRWEIRASADSRAAIRAMLRDGTLGSPAMLGWAAEWARSGFPHVHVDDLLAASMMASKMPRSTVADLQTPWPAFRLDLPTGLLPCDDAPERCWASALVQWWGNRVFMLVLPSGGWRALHLGLRKPEELADSIGLDKSAEGFESFESQERRAIAMIDRLFLGVCAHLSSPERLSELAAQRDSATHRAGEGRRPPGSPPKIWTYELRRDVRVDVRAAVQAYVDGGGSSPTVQMLIPGHYRRQHYGPRNATRVELIQIDAYWRGPEDAPIAVRKHVLG
ncbi:hypothetical protein LVJ94_34615 [Pendulispora rubella]|uniref:Uncharacterized protein n=1 Tax=Pendulispora rubella TaxID=2741070 RepID=A0ABZ2KTM7_9BACT